MRHRALTLLSLVVCSPTLAFAQAAPPRRASAPTPVSTPTAAPVAAPIATPVVTPVAPAVPTATAPDAARVNFEEGIAALQDERYADALPAFERSYRARRVASVALNLGVTLRALGRLIEARQRFREFIALASPTQHVQHDGEIASYLAVIERQVGRVHLTGVDLAACVVHVDQRRVRADGGGEVEVDPGDHRVTLEPDGFLPMQRSLHVDPGETADLHLSPSRPPGWIFTRWWFWSGIAVAASAGATAGVLYSRTPSDPPPVNTGVTIQAGGQ